MSAAMTGPTIVALSRAWTATILRDEPDPATWLLRVRAGAEALGLCPARCMSLPATLQHLASEVIREAWANGLGEASVREVLRLPEEE